MLFPILELGGVYFLTACSITKGSITISTTAELAPRGVSRTSPYEKKPGFLGKWPDSGLESKHA
jgi:hypothetical protein